VDIKEVAISKVLDQKFQLWLYKIPLIKKFVLQVKLLQGDYFRFCFGIIQNNLKQL